MATSKRQSRAGLPAYLLLSGGLLFSGIASDQCVAQAKLYSEPVTDADLAATSAEDWLSFRGNLASWGYSALDQIDRFNVDRLAFAWSATMATGPNEPSPLIRDGVLYLPHSGDIIQALDARTGDLLWEYRRQWPEEIRGKRNMASLGRPINRCVAIHGDALYATTGDAYLIRLTVVRSFVRATVQGNSADAASLGNPDSDRGCKENTSLPISPVPCFADGDCPVLSECFAEDRGSLASPRSADNLSARTTATRLRVHEIRRF